LQPGPNGQSISGGGLLSGGTITTPSGGGSLSGTSTSGAPSDAPYSGGSQVPGGLPADVESQLARTWPEYRKEWKDWYHRWVKPYAETAIDELAPPGYPMARDALEIGVKGGSIITVEQQAKRARQAMAEDPNGRGPLEWEEYERRKRQHNERSEP
jgi:hypothetical protein